MALTSDVFPAVKKQADSTHSPYLDWLNDIAALVTLEEISKSGSVSYLVASASTAGKYYRQTLDFVQHVSIPHTIKGGDIRRSASGTEEARANAQGGETGTSEERNSITVSLVVGVGVRVIANYSSSKSGVDLGDISSVGFAAESSQISGSISLRVMGFGGAEIVKTVQLPTKLNRTTIESTLQIIATIKASIYQSNTTVRPELVGLVIHKLPAHVTVNDVLLGLQIGVDDVEKTVKAWFTKNVGKKATTPAAANQGSSPKTGR